MSESAVDYSSLVKAASSEGLQALFSEVERVERYNRLDRYRAYPKLREFHALGKTHPERLLMAANRGHPLWFKVLTPDGFRPIGELRVGDAVMAGDGSETTVAGIAELGERDIYNVVFDAGIVVPCTDDHLWAVRSPQRKAWALETTLEAAARKMSPRTPACGVVRWGERDLPIDPYLLGLLLGDGSFGRRVKITTLDQEIVDAVAALVPATTRLDKQGRFDWYVSTRHNGRGRRNDLLDALEALGLRGVTGAEKFVPKPYLLASPDQRLALLQGLMDTDGSAQVRGRSVRFQFWNTSPSLCQAVAFLARSLGGQASIRPRGRAEYRHPDGSTRPCKQAFVVTLRMTQVPFRLKRKAERAPRLSRSADTLDHIWRACEPSGNEAARCIKVAHASGLYICDGFIVTHNTGKTFGGAHEVALHLTGRYPEWWDGREFKKASRWWVASETTEMTVAGVQGNLLGRVEDGLGTGAMPKDAIVEYKRSAHGFPGAIQFAIVRHGGGGDVQAGQSYVGFKSYDQGREKFQADTLDGVWLDEEPDSAIYFEALTRISTTNGMVFMTFTPLKGPTAVVMRFLIEKPAGTAVVNMTIDDAEHISREERDKIIARYPAHEREARTKGVPALGSGRVFPVSDSTISCQRFKVPDHWFKIGGLDFGWDHPTAAVELAVDRDHDRYFVMRTHRQREATPVTFAATLRAWGVPWMPWAWPHDGMQHDKGSGIQLAEAYRAQGLNLTAERATFDDGSNGVEAGVQQMLDLMLSGRFFVCDDLTEWFEEFRFYHRQDGKIVKLSDDLISATRYAFMMQRMADLPPREVKRVDRGRQLNWKTM